MPSNIDGSDNLRPPWERSQEWLCHRWHRHPCLCFCLGRQMVAVYDRRPALAECRGNS